MGEAIIRYLLYANTPKTGSLEVFGHKGRPISERENASKIESS